MSETFGKIIKLYLKDGTSFGIKFAEIINNTILSISCPRIRLAELMSVPETKKPGVYFLFGEDEENGEPMAYIGESENSFERLKDHIINKDFWNVVVFINSKDENLTKSHIRYLESRLIQMAQSSKRYKIDNTNQSHGSLLPPSDIDAMEEFLTFIKLLLGSLGHTLLEEQPGKNSKEGKPMLAAMPIVDISVPTTTELSLFISEIRANAVQTEEGIVVLKGSEAAREHTGSLQPGYRTLRQKLINEGTLELAGNKYIFKENVLFKAASPAAAIVVGYNINGPQSWKDKTGRTLKEIETQRLKS
jgi:hypothetical protein